LIRFDSIGGVVPVILTPAASCARPAFARLRKQNAAKKVGLEVKAIEAAHVARRIDAVEYLPDARSHEAGALRWRLNACAHKVC
jgi:hypothetical protein